MSKITGGCLCGAIRYESESAPIKMMASDCRHCQKHTGKAIAISFGVPQQTLRVRGLVPSVYEDFKPSGKHVLRSFCPECGTPLFTESDSQPTMIFIQAATLDNEWWADSHKYSVVRQGQHLTEQPHHTPPVLEWPEDELQKKAS